MNADLFQWSALCVLGRKVCPDITNLCNINCATVSSYCVWLSVVLRSEFIILIHLKQQWLGIKSGLSVILFFLNNNFTYIDICAISFLCLHGFCEDSLVFDSSQEYASREMGYANLPQGVNIYAHCECPIDACCHVFSECACVLSRINQLLTNK